MPQHPTTPSGGSQPAKAQSAEAQSAEAPPAGSEPAPLVLCSGATLPGEIWTRVRALLPGRRALHLDRSGIDYPGSGPVTVPSFASALQRLVDLLETLDRPAVLVAHSMSAFLAEAVARQHPHLVASLVLVDPSVEDPPPGPAAGPATQPCRRIHRLLLSALRRVPSLPAGMRPHRAPWWTTYLFRKGAVAAATAEYLAYPIWAAELEACRVAHRSLQAPVTQLVALGRSAWPAGTDWLRAQNTLGERLRADGSPAVSVQLVPHCSHLVMRDAPQRVATTVIALTARVAARPPSPAYSPRTRKGR